MDPEFMSLIDALTAEKGINKDVLLDTIKHALQTAYRKKVGKDVEVEIAVDEKTGAYRVFAVKTVVDDSTEELTENDIVYRDALKYDGNAEIGGVIRIDVTPNDFGRMAVLNAKQVIEQKLKEAERDSLYEEFAAKQDEIIMATVQRVEYKPDPKIPNKLKKTVYVNLEKTDCAMYEKDQVVGEDYKPNMKIPVYVYNVEKTTKGPRICVSHAHPQLIVRMLEKEIPELADGTIVIKQMVREAGVRTKLAVYSRLENVDAVGTCIGPKGMRVGTVMKELKNDRTSEKVDILAWDKDPKQLVTNALLPAKVKKMFVDEMGKKALAVVDEKEFPVAIGKGGMNVRLASKLTGMQIDIKTVPDFDRMVEENADFGFDIYREPKFDNDEFDIDELGEIMKKFENDITDFSDEIEKNGSLGVDLDENA